MNLIQFLWPIVDFNTFNFKINETKKKTKNKIENVPLHLPTIAAIICGSIRCGGQYSLLYWGMFGTTGDSRRLSRPSRSLAQHHQHQQQQQQHGQQQKHMPAPSVYANLHQLQPTIHQPIQPITNLWPTIQSTLSISNTGSICRHLPSLQLQSNGEGKCCVCERVRLFSPTADLMLLVICSSFLSHT